MALSDVAFFRAWTTLRTSEGQPFLYLLQPADAYAAYALTVAMATHEGPCYLRTLRPDVPFLYNEATAFTLGGHHVLAEGHDLCIIATGYMVQEVQKALPLLKEQGITATLVDLYSLPFDDVAILELVQKNHGQVLTVEDNYGASMGSAVADALALHGGSYTLMQMYVRQLPKSGRTPDEVLRFLQLSASDIVHTAVSMLDVASR
jgi:transketolase